MVLSAFESAAAKAATMPDRTIRRVYVLTPRLTDISGSAQSFTTLGIELTRRGIEVQVFVREPVRKNNQYSEKLQEHNIRVISPPRVLGLLDKIDWRTRAKVLACLARVACPFFLPIIIGDAMRKRRSLARSWSGAIGHIHGILVRYLSPHLERLPEHLDRYLYAQLDRHARECPPDIVEVYGADFLRTIAWGRRHHIPVVYKHCETPNEWTPDQDEYMRMASCVIAKSESSKQALLSMSRYDGQVLVIPNALDPQMFLHEPNDPPSIDRPATGMIRLIYIGRLSPIKGAQFLPETFKQVVDAVQNIELVLVGRGRLEKQLKSDFQRLGISDHVQFRGTLTHAETLRALRSSDILIFPSLGEGLPNTILEALACGTPVVATNTAGTSDLIADGVNGLLVPPSAPKLMAEAIIRVATDSSLRARLGERARETFRSGTWSPEVLGDRTLRAYHYARQVFSMGSAETSQERQQPSSG